MNYDGIVVPETGEEEANTKEYVKLITSLFVMKEADEKYFINKVTKRPLKIHLILGLRSQESLLKTIRAEETGYVHPWQLSNLSIQRNPPITNYC